jgi:PAS domain S-box-containing protein
MDGRSIACVLVSDISERKKTEQTLRLLSQLLDKADEAIITRDETGAITYANGALERLYGWKPNDVVGRKMTEVALAEVAKQNAEEVMGELRAGRSWTLESIAKRADGSNFWARVTDTPLLNDDGALTAIIGISADISERKQQEEVLATERRRLRAAEAIGRVASWEMDVFTNQVVCSDLLYEIHGLQKDDLIATRSAAMQLIHPDDAGEVDAALDECVRTGEPMWCRYRVHRVNNGEPRWLDVRAERITEGGRAVRLAGTVADVTDFVIAASEVEAARDLALEASRQKSAFLATMSHEIRTPMNAVIGMTGLLLDTSLDEFQREFVETLRTSGDALLSIINDILDFSKIEAGGLDLEQQPFDLRSCVEESLALVAGTSKDKGLELVGYVDDGCPSRVIGDVTRLRQVLVNLLANAVKFTQQGEVVLSVELDGSSYGEMVLRFAVADTGIGIPPDRVATLFDSFSQVDASTTRVYGGTGLGLAISKRLVDAMGGTLEVESVLSAGTTFRFSAPFPEAEEFTAISEAPFATTLNGRSVLVVDSNATSRRALCLQLESWGANVTDAGSGGVAIAFIDSGMQFAAAVVDMEMPDMTSQEFAVRLRSSTTAGKIPIILLRSILDRSTLHAEDLFSTVLTKPIRSVRLRHSLRNVLAPHAIPSASSDLRGLSAGTEVATLRVLLAEDNTVNQRLGRLMLEKLGHYVDTVGNGQEAVEAVRRVPYDVVLMDVEMPQMDGLEATKAIRLQLPRHRQPQIVAMTAGAFIEDQRACTEAGMDDYIAKPVRLEGLDATLKRAVTVRNTFAMTPAGPLAKSDVDQSAERFQEDAP